MSGSATARAYKRPLAPSLAQPSASAAPQRAPELSVVKVPVRSRSSLAFAVLCLVVLSATLVGNLVLNTAMINGSFEKSRLQRSIAQEAQRNDMLTTNLDKATSPETLAQRATEYGMVTQAAPLVIRLADKSIIGLGG